MDKRLRPHPSEVTMSSTINSEGYRVMRLIDDTSYPLKKNQAVVRRDPLVEALFGAAAASVATLTAGTIKRVRQRD
ncbi:MAG: hypothetical protein V4508_07295 [Pseudomonadota bacterium]